MPALCKPLQPGAALHHFVLARTQKRRRRVSLATGAFGWVKGPKLAQLARLAACQCRAVAALRPRDACV
ncbi:MAG: hypothetical protein CFE44_14380 [Burkholderiales bacterium PBB4]|nr:MAG: hypothetical protein CFE44_14380 [Burkholderiales bacterium PBB4]